MIVGLLTTCHTKYTWDRSICIFLFNRTTLHIFVSYLTGALYGHHLWFYKHQHENRVRSKLFFLLHTNPVSWNCAYHLWMELSDGGCFPNLVRNCCWTIVTDRHSWNISTQNAFSLPFAAILVNSAPSGEMHNYCTLQTIKENLWEFLDPSV